MSGLQVADFDFDLPPELIAQSPPPQRGQSRMLLVNRQTGMASDALFGDLPSRLRPNDLLVLNESRVIPARLFARRKTLEAGREPTGLVEVLLIEPAGSDIWRALVKPGRKVGVGDQLIFPAPSGAIELEAEVIARSELGERVIRFAPVQDFFAVLERVGHVPLPPYIRRHDADDDRERYQTVFARERGSVAAPTAGLHFTSQLLDALADQGVEIARVTLHVGLGTFSPLRVEHVEDVRLHQERYTLSEAAAEAVNRARREKRRIVAVGTTVVRTLEHCALTAESKPLKAHSGVTSIFIAPGFQFRVVDALLTNFHLPRSSLLMLVSAFAGQQRVLAAYRHAVAARYRFFSYGDCMFLE